MLFRRIVILGFFMSSCFPFMYGFVKEALGISLPPSVAPAAAPSPSHTAAVFFPNVRNVLDFGAIGDGVTDDTEAFKTAWDDACQIKGSLATLFAPAGYSFMLQSTIFTGPCKNNLTFQIEGTIMPPDGPELWPRSMSKRQWLVFYRINGMVMKGNGVIDGRGQKWWQLPCKPHRGKKGTTLPGPCDSPIGIRFFMSSNLRMQTLKMKNSPQFHLRFDSCQHVKVEMLTINSPANSPNTDGIHIENANNVEIHNSFISNGDDCISIGSGCYNVDIKNVTCGPSHGISIGSLGSRNSRACVWNITVRDSVITNSDNGVRIKTWQGGSGSVTKVIFKNIFMDTVRNPIIIDQYYCMTKHCINQTSAVFVNDIVYKNIRGTYDTRSLPMHLACSDWVPCTNLALSEVKLLPAKGSIVADPFCWNAYGRTQTLNIPPVYCLGEFPPSIMLSDIKHC